MRATAETLDDDYYNGSDLWFYVADDKAYGFQIFHGIGIAIWNGLRVQSSRTVIDLVGNSLDPKFTRRLVKLK